MADERLLDTFRRGRHCKYSVGEIILSATEVSGAFYVVSGFVKVYSISDQGKKYLHIIYGPSEIFPLIWILRGVRRKVFYEAVTNTEVYEIGKAEFLKLVEQDNQFAKSVISHLAEQVNIFADRLDNLQYSSGYEKVVYRILFLAGRFGRKQGGKILIDAPITHELIAESVNMARESVSRQMEKLHKKGLISSQHGRIVIDDVQALSREFSQPVSLDIWGLGG